LYLSVQDWKRLAGPAATAIVAFERRLEEWDLPKFERSTYARAVDKGGQAGGERALAALTAHVCQQAGKLLDRLAAKAADALGLPGVPSDQDMLEMLEEAAEAYSFEPAESSSSGRGVRYAAAGIGLAGGGGGGSSIAASRQQVPPVCCWVICLLLVHLYQFGSVVFTLLHPRWLQARLLLQPGVSSTVGVEKFAKGGGAKVGVRIGFKQIGQMIL
jgi:hypothetical protein